MRRRRAATDGEGGSRRRSGRGAAYGALGLLARLIDIVVGVVALVIIVGILFVVFEANKDNGIVKAITDAAKFLVGPFDGMFTPKDRKLEVAVNWGIALIVYVIVGRVLAGLLNRRGH